MISRTLVTLVVWLLPLAASAASLETLVMPGPVIEGHADLEDDCSNCHDVFDRSAQRQLCLDCHEPVALDLAAGDGFHSLHAEASTAPCRQCHTEHKGRNADIVGLAPEMFDHQQTDFPLDGPHAQQPCGSCHEIDLRYAEAPNTCEGCHQADDTHKGAMGENCGECHAVVRWEQGEFDHDTTDFALTGKHQPLACLACHVDRLFESPGGTCIDCHRLDDAHGGARGDDCGDCHGSESWDADFEHEAETGFALRGAHEALVCRNCHVSESDYSGLPTDCQGCHSGDDAHLGRNGTECGDCHGEKTWEIRFDHGAETGYELVGAHAEQDCTACHKGSLADPLPTDCGDCHAVDNPHGASFVECADCHEQTQWSEVPRFQHDLTRFALVGMHRTASCEQCHATFEYAPEEDACVACHATEDAHDGAFGEGCDDCHNPVGWDFWRFDHTEQTEFALIGAHEGLVCEACHRPGSRADKQASVCVSCHRGDDVHRGGFGQQCDRCHDSESFSNPVIPK